MSDNEETLVLVADDEPSTLALITAHVRSKGFKVVEASDGDMAWQLAHEHLPDLVILDVMMPGMSGWEVCRKIRESLPLAHTGVVMLTGIGEHLNEMTSPLYGADAHVDKPFEFSDLDEKIEQTLAARRDGSYGRPDGADEEDGSTDDEPSEDLVARASSDDDDDDADDVPPPAVTQPSPPMSDEAGSVDEPIDAPVPKKVAKKKVAPKKAEPAEKGGKKAAKKATKKAAKKTSKKVTKKVAKKTAKKATKKTVAKKVTKKVAKKATKKASKKKTARKKA